MQGGKRALHEALPDQRRIGAAGDRAAVVVGQHRHESIRIAHPDGHSKLRRVADEPRVAVVLGRPRLAGRRPVRQGCTHAGSLGEDALEDRVLRRDGFLAQRALPDELVAADTPVAAVEAGRSLAAHGEDRPRVVAGEGAVDPKAAVSERGERARHLERVHRLSAEPDREVGPQAANDPEPARRLGDIARADEPRQLREDAVVGVDRRGLQVDRPEVRAFVVVHWPCGPVEVERHRLRDERRPRRDTFLEGGREHERLER